jgi:rhamnosyltransferase
MTLTLQENRPTQPQFGSAGTLPWSRSCEPHKSNACAVIISYDPDNGLRDRIAAVRAQVQEVLIVDNNSRHDCFNLLRRIASVPGTHLIRNEENVGVGSALNQGARWAVARGYSWVLALDQDTVVAQDMVESLCAVYRAYPERAKLAVIGSNSTNSVNGKPLHHFDGADGSLAKEVGAVITSGSLVSLEKFHEIGGFRGEFFIDCVDLEYCVQARERGFRVVVSCRPLMEHSIGHLSEHHLPWKKTGTSNHSAVRRYYMARNHLVLVREHVLRTPIWVLATFFSFVKCTILMVFFEKDRLRKVKYTAMGIVDGLFGHFGRKLS